MFKQLLRALYYFIKPLLLMLFVPKHLRFKDVSDDIVLITGGGFGLGRLLAVRFAKLGAKVVIWDIDEGNMKQTCDIVKRVGGECLSFKCDISEPNNVYATADRVRAEVGHVSMIINNAGVVNGQFLLEIPDNKIENTFKVNVMSHYWIYKTFLPNMMKENKGHLVSIDSVTSLFGVYRLTDYCASKAASRMLQDAVSCELRYSGYDGIKTTSICPYFMSGPMFSGATSKLVRILDPSYVADEIVNAVLINQHTLWLPKMFYIFAAYQLIAPFKSSSRFFDILFGSQMMTTFMGKKENMDSNELDSNLNIDWNLEKTKYTRN